MSNEHNPNYSIIPPTGAFGQDVDNERGSQWPSKFVLPQGPSGTFSIGGWTEGHEGFIQQTFLGASVRNFNIAGGFGDSSSTLSVELVEDEYNKSDSTFLGLGDDVYHSGNGDKFVPPPVGTPVFFKFGKNWATVEQAYRRTIEETYNITKEDGIVIDREAWEFKRDLRDDFTPHPESGYDIVESGMFSTVPYEVSGNMPNERDKYYLRQDGYVKTSTSSESEDPRDDRRYWVDKSFLYEHDNRDRGFQHFVFGGILQSVVESRSPNGNPLQTVQITDPREILSNCSIILNDYAGTTFNNKNLFNVYGFLEYDPSDELQKRLDEKALFKWVVEKQVDQKGLVRYYGNDKDKPISSVTYLNTNISPPALQSYQVNPSEVNWDVYRFPQTIQENLSAQGGKMFQPQAIDFDYGADSELYPKFFPITGEGFSRRSEQGMPWYRVSQGLAALFEQYGKLPEEYREAGFGGTIDFRGFNYIVDFGGIPLEKIPKTYMINYNQTDLLSLAQELCDVISHDLFVSLLPVIDPLTKTRDDLDEKAAIMNSAFARNNYWSKKASEAKFQSDEYNEAVSNIIHGIIRIDAIDRSKQPKYGAIQNYINRLEDQGIHVENRDLGFELSNVTTDKFVAGAQEVDMYYFSTYKDRDSLEFRKKKAGVANKLDFINEQQWSLEASLKQQVLPFYGFLGKKALSIPRGFGSYQQIMLDTTGLDAHGVGNYYVATEIELRHALVSYQNWADFLARQYNETYIEEVGELKKFYKELFKTTSEDIEGLGNAPDGDPYNIEDLENREFGVSVPRCVFNSDKNFMGPDGYPASPCSPPYGYPLYYKRAEKLGIARASFASLSSKLSQVITQIEKIEEFADSDEDTNVLAVEKQSLERMVQQTYEKYQDNYSVTGNMEAYFALRGLDNNDTCIQQRIEEINQETKRLKAAGKNTAVLQQIKDSAIALTAEVDRMSRRGFKNSKKVYDFLRKVAEENLGKRFLVKIPRYCNVNYSETVEFKKYYGIQGFAEDETPIYADVTDSIRDVYSGPFGFKPLPVNASGQSLLESQNFIFKMHQIRADQLITKSWDYERFTYKDNFAGSSDPNTADKTYGYGALKGNYNPISEKWAFNYKPEPQGGFFNFALHPRNLTLSQIELRSLPNKNLSPAVNQLFAPKDLSNFVSENGRISCYVRYDNSQYLDFRGISADSITQEIVVGNRFIPDILSELDNVGTSNDLPENGKSRRESSEEKRQQAVAYVKCEIDENLYMPPKSELTPAMVYGRDITFVPNFSPPEIIEDVDQSGCRTFTCVQPYAEPIFAPSNRNKSVAGAVGYERLLPPEKVRYNDTEFTVQKTFGNPIRPLIGGGLDGTVIKHTEYQRRYDKEQDSFIIDTEEQNLDSDHVYALVTVPGRVTPNINQRHMDSDFFAVEGASIKNALTQDVVRGPLGFEKPAEIVNEKVKIDCSQFTFEELEDAASVQRNAVRSTSLIGASLNLTQPSPVFPNIFALPLMSTERCYGPWRSAASIAGSKDRYTDIGGKIEFVKDENLAPWNYAGYQLMDEAGLLQAEFSNSLLLFSERGGFVFPSTPSGLSIGKALEESGPLVTSMSVNVSEAGVKTTVKMDLYTSRFGRLQKQKEDAIAQIVRERQKIIDTNNEMIRKGYIKSASSPNFGAGLTNSVNQFTGDASSFLGIEQGQGSSNAAYRVVKNPTRRVKNLETGGAMEIDQGYSQDYTFFGASTLEVLDSSPSRRPDPFDTSMTAYTANRNDIVIEIRGEMNTAYDEEAGYSSFGSVPAREHRQTWENLNRTNGLEIENLEERQTFED
jgi:hypothetical protein